MSSDTITVSMRYAQFITIDRILPILIALLGVGLLMWNRLDVEPHAQAMNLETGDIIERGQIMTASDAFAAFAITDTQIYLSKNTEVRLVDGREGQVDLQLIQGRVVLAGPAHVSIREVDIATQGQASIVHYSWSNEIEVATIEGSASITYADQVLILTDDTVRMQTLAPYKIEVMAFDPLASSEADFYSWVANYEQ